MTTQTTTKNEALELLKALNVKVDALQAAVAALAARPASSGRQAGGEGCFPNYGKAQGMPIKGADMKDLEFYAAGARRSLADESKQRFWAKEQKLLEAIEAEIARQAHGDGPPPHTDNDAPF